MHVTMTRTISLKALFILGILFMAEGCATLEGTLQAYSGPQLAARETALLKPVEQTFLSADTVELEYVDGQRVRPYLNAEVLPGEHTVTLSLYTTRGNTMWQFQKILAFVAEQGQSYIAHAKDKGFFIKFTTWFWIEEEQTGKVVAGQRPK